MKISALLFLLAGIGMLASLPFLAGAGLYLWVAAKGAYAVGIGFYILEFVWKPH